jgi:hypothetical protein
VRNRIIQVLIGLAMASVLILGQVGPGSAPQSLARELPTVGSAGPAVPAALCGIDGGGSGA